MKKNIIALVLLIILPFWGISQYKFEETLPITYDDYLYSQDIDSGTVNYIATGYTTLFGKFNADILLVKWNGNGMGYNWVKRYSGPSGYKDIGRHVMKTSDSGYLISGTTNSYNSGANYNAFTLKLDYSGNVSWINYWGDSYNDYAYTSCEDAYYYYVAGSIGKSSTASYTNGFICCFNKSTGALVWGKRYMYGNDSYYTTFSSMIVGYDGNLYVTGTATLTKTGQNLILCSKINPANGSEYWTKRYNISGVNLTSANIAKGHNNGYIMTGVYNSSTTYKVMLLKVTSNGTVSWGKNYYHSGGTNDNGIQAIKTTDGYAVYGVTKSFGSDDLFLMNTDTAGSINWLKLYHGLSSNDGSYSFRSLGTALLYLGVDGYAMVSGLKDTASTYTDSYLLKTDANGQTGCETDTSFTETSLSVSANTLSFTLYDINVTDSTMTKVNLNPGWDTICPITSISFKRLADINSVSINNETINIYPNPASNNINIDLSGLKSEYAEINIFDYTGHLILTSSSAQTNNGLLNIDVCHFSKGMYIVTIRTENNQHSQKIIIE